MILPEVYQIEVSSICNLECPMCNSRFFPRADKTPFLNPDLIKLMIDRGDLASSYFIELQMSGEPLLNPKLWEIINLIKTNTGIAVGLSTNGWFIRENILSISKLDHLTISVDSFSNYDSIRVSKSGVKRDIIGFIKDIELTIKEVPHVDLQFIELSGWGSEVAAAIDLFGKYDNVTIRSLPNTMEAHMYKEVLVSDELCINPWYSVSVQANGNVVPCCYSQGDSVIYGNLYTKSLKDIWNSPAVESFRESHRNRNLCDMCSKCLYRSPALLYHHNMFHDKIKGSRLCQK